MISTTWTNAPAGFLGLGSTDVRPYSGVVVCPTAAPVRGTALPAAGVGGAVVRLRPATERNAIDPITTHNSMTTFTTLGLQSPGRPPS